jgi:hypothetical protein
MDAEQRVQPTTAWTYHLAVTRRKSLGHGDPAHNLYTRLVAKLSRWVPRAGLPPNQPIRAILAVCCPSAASGAVRSAAVRPSA